MGLCFRFGFKLQAEAFTELLEKRCTVSDWSYTLRNHTLYFARLLKVNVIWKGFTADMGPCQASHAQVMPAMHSANFMTTAPFHLTEQTPILDTPKPENPQPENLW